MLSRSVNWLHAATYRWRRGQVPGESTGKGDNGIKGDQRRMNADTTGCSVLTAKGLCPRVPYFKIAAIGPERHLTLLECGNHPKFPLLITAGAWRDC